METKRSVECTQTTPQKKKTHTHKVEHKNSVAAMQCDAMRKENAKLSKRIKIKCYAKGKSFQFVVVFLCSIFATFETKMCNVASVIGIARVQ